MSNPIIVERHTAKKKLSCDNCYISKVKCNGDPCLRCLKLNRKCTRTRSRRKRRVAEVRSSKQQKPSKIEQGMSEYLFFFFFVRLFFMYVVFRLVTKIITAHCFITNLLIDFTPKTWTSGY